VLAHRADRPAPGDPRGVECYGQQSAGRREPLFCTPARVAAPVLERVPVFAASRVAGSLLVADDHAVWAYALRCAAFGVILVAILTKNRAT